jgi:hypothetical protein
MHNSYERAVLHPPDKSNREAYDSHWVKSVWHRTVCRDVGYPTDELPIRGVLRGLTQRNFKRLLLRKRNAKPRAA